MGLWILSQDEFYLEEVHSININYQNKKQIICNYKPDFIGTQGEYYVLLGTYKTEERAKEVLKEIQVFLESNYETYIPQHDSGLYGARLVCHSRKVVFEMPKD